ncbi:hypothetical protein [Brevibacillus sp. NRS-1366]|uniref:hypothetical protein n=1 Tax=Brevibacillus sp. NRS-1366 TaxID=3233899 RepID=UPI003D1A1D29
MKTHKSIEIAKRQMDLLSRVRIIPNYACTVMNLFSKVVVAQGGEVVGEWAVDARGRVQ